MRHCNDAAGKQGDGRREGVREGIEIESEIQRQREEGDVPEIKK